MGRQMRLKCCQTPLFCRFIQFGPLLLYNRLIGLNQMFISIFNWIDFHSNLKPQRDMDNPSNSFMNSRLPDNNYVRTLVSVKPTQNKGMRGLDGFLTKKNSLIKRIRMFACIMYVQRDKLLHLSFYVTSVDCEFGQLELLQRLILFKSKLSVTSFLYSVALEAALFFATMATSKPKDHRTGGVPKTQHLFPLSNISSFIFFGCLATY